MWNKIKQSFDDYWIFYWIGAAVIVAIVISCFVIPNVKRDAVINFVADKKVEACVKQKELATCALEYLKSGDDDGKIEIRAQAIFKTEPPKAEKKK